MTPDCKSAALSQINSIPNTKFKKKVMKRLIDVKLSPLNERKQVFFLKLVNNDSESLASIELGIDIDSTIKETKDMLINICS